MTRGHSDERSLGALFGDLASQNGTLVKKEVQLAKTEILEKTKDLGKHAGKVVAGGVIAHVGLLALTAALIIGLGSVMPRWLSALFGAEIATQAGLPEDLFPVLPGYGATGEALIDCADMIAFTGSAETGKRVMRRAAERLIPVSLELGGKDPMIVLADADIDRAIEHMRDALREACA